MEQDDFDLQLLKVFNMMEENGCNLAKYRQTFKHYVEVLTWVTDHLSLGQENLWESRKLYLSEDQ